MRALLEAHPEAAQTRGYVRSTSDLAPSGVRRTHRSPYRTQGGKLPLHFAAQMQASKAVVGVLLEAHPEAAQTKDEARSHTTRSQPLVSSPLVPCRSQGGRLPLHIAAANQASMAVVQVLLGLHPKAAQTRDGAVTPAMLQTGSSSASFAASAFTVRELAAALGDEPASFGGSGEGFAGVLP